MQDKPRRFPFLAKLLSCAAFALASTLFANAAAGQRTIVRAGRLLDPETGRIFQNQIIVVENGRITQVKASIARSAGDSVIDLSSYTVLPGLIDAHVHLIIGGQIRDNARAILAAGFTTAVDLGARSTRIVGIRDSINRGLIAGPRMLAAGSWVGVKNGVCEFNGIGIAGGADAFRARVRENISAGADVIKACVSGWPADAFAHPNEYEMPDSILAAIVDEAKRAGKRVIVHDISIGGVRSALRAGVQGLAHAAYLDSAAANEMRARGVFMIPTLASLTRNDTSAGSRALVAATTLAYRNRVPLVFGTDGGVLPHGQNAQEFSVLTAAGITPIDAIRSATIGAARALGLADTVGTIAPGKSADIIAVDGNPLTDITALQRVGFVMLRGRVVKSPSDSAPAQQFPLSAAEIADSALATSMPKLAAKVLAEYHDTNRIRFLDNRFRLEMLSEQYTEAAKTLAALRQAQRDTTAPTRALYVQYEILTAAMTAPGNASFAQRFAAAFRARFAHLDDAASGWAARRLLQSPQSVAADLRWARPELSGRTTVSLDEALTLLRVFNAVQSYRRFAGLPAALVAEDDARRYVIETNIAVKTPDDAVVCALVARPQSARGKLASLMQFTIYADSVASLRDALLTAGNGYAGVTAFTRGKACSSGEVVPYKYDGRDAAAVIEWIARQPWSDGRVGMYGGSYSGFTAWAATKYMPAPLKAIMVGAPVAPGVDVPMEGNVSVNFIYPWPFYTTNNRWLDNVTYNDFGRWNRLNREWYTTGRSYRDMEKIDGTPNPVFDEWIAHPAVDSYWRSTIPQGSDYKRINIPVLQTAGYFFGGPGGALWYFREHYKNNPRAQHYMLWGPYDHPQAQRGVVTLQSDTATWIAGYTIDSAARIDIVTRLRYQWFDYALKGARRPALLADRVNYEMMGADAWRHASSITAMSTSRTRLYLNARTSAKRYTLTPAPGAAASSVTLSVNLADRSDIDAPFVGGLRASTLDTSNAVTFVSEPLRESIDIAGTLSGHLEFIANRRDFDFTITMYELRPDGQYFYIAPFTARASYAENPSKRRLLNAGQIERVNFGNGIRMMARRVAAGSRIVMTLGIPKSSAQQINYGTGRDVSGESISDAKDPLRIQWLPQSYVELPVRR